MLFSFVNSVLNNYGIQVLLYICLTCFLLTLLCCIVEKSVADPSISIQQKIGEKFFLSYLFL
jgi:hypothetical protein